MNSLPDVIDRAPERTTPIPWQAFKSELLGFYKPPVVAPATKAKMAQVIREIEACGVETTADLTTAMVARFIGNRPAGQSAHTLQSLLASLRAVCSYAETAGYVRVSPFRLRKLNRWVRLGPLTGRRHYPKEEIRRVLELAARDVLELTGPAQWRARRLQVVLAVIAYTGMRKNEALRLQVADVELPARAIWIRPHGTRLKTAASEAPVPIPAALLPILESWIAHRMDGAPLPDCPWFIPTLDRKAPWVSGAPGGKALDRLQALGARAGVDGMTFKGLRASLATHLEPVAGPALIQRILRHTTVRTSEAHYRKADLPNLVGAMHEFDF